MPNGVTLYPIYRLADESDEEPFDCAALPIQIVEHVGIEDVSQMFDEETFKWVGNAMGQRALEDLQRVRYAIVHRYEAKPHESVQPSGMLVRNLAACLRLIRPMRQRASLMRGEVRENGKLDLQQFDHPIDLEVPEVQKLFGLRNRDAELLRVVGADFLRAMGGEFWKFRMAVEFHDTGHFQYLYPKARYLLWCSAVEAIFTSRPFEHRGSLVAKERIKWFLGPGTPVYDPGDIPPSIPQPNITVAGVVDDLYKVRNFVAHGDRIPGEYFGRIMRRGLNRDLGVVDVLLEAVSFIVRKSLLRILTEHLLDHFASATSAEAYFDAAGLTRTKIRQRQQGARGEDEE